MLMMEATIGTMQATQNTCEKRCGLCCQTLVGSDFWEKGLTEEQKELLLKERKEHKGCEMLIFENGLATCLVQKTLGFKRDDCVKYPKERHKYCLRQKNES